MNQASPSSVVSTFFIAIGLAWFWGSLFYPGYVTADSNNQWIQAWRGSYDNWHPIGATLLFRFFVLLFREFPYEAVFGYFTYFQIFAFWFVVLASSLSVLKKKRTKLCVTVVLILYYPLWVFAATHEKDPWSSAFYLLFIVYFTSRDEFLRFSRTEVSFLLLIALFFSLTRHTSFPTLCLCLVLFPFWPSYRKGIAERRLKKGLVLLTAILGIAIGIFSLDRTLRVHHHNLENLYLSYELVGSLHFAKPSEDELASLSANSFLGSTPLHRLIRAYNGNINEDQLIFGKRAPISHEILLQSDFAKRDLPGIVWRHPFSLLKHKLCVLNRLFQFPQFSFRQLRQSSPNQLQVHNASRFPNLRRQVYCFLDKARSNAWIQVPFRHGYLGAASLAWILGLILCAGRKKMLPVLDRSLKIWVAGLCYALPYFVICPGGQWRYLSGSHLCWLLCLFQSAELTIRLWRVRRKTSRHLLSLFQYGYLDASRSS